MYGRETWALRKAEQNLLERTEMRMMRWMMGWIEKIRTEETRTGVEFISEKIRESILRWLPRVERNTEEDVVTRTWKTEVGGHRKIGRPKLRWSDVTRKYMKEKQVKIEEVEYRRTWKLKTMRRPQTGKRPKKKQCNGPLDRHGTDSISYQH